MRIVICSALSVLILISCNENTQHAKSSDKAVLPLEDSAKILFESFDSVMISSHRGRDWDAGRSSNTLPEIPPVLLNGRPNYGAMKMQLKLSPSKFDTLVSIFSGNTKEEINTACIFDPHHTIFLVKKGNYSYIDLCFHCYQFEASKDLEGFINLDQRKWGILQRFFEDANILDTTLRWQR